MGSIVGTNPSASIRRSSAPGARPDRIRFLSFEEAEAFIGAAEESPTGTAQVVVALRTGLHIGELLALRWEDVDRTSHTMSGGMR